MSSILALKKKGRRRHGRAIVLCAAALMAVLTSCSPTSGDAGATRAPASSPDSAGAVGPLTGTPLSEEQVAALADDSVTYDEYTAGYRRYISCVAAGGYQIVEEDQVNQVFHYAVPDAAVDSGVNDSCYDKEFSYLDSTWQLAQEDTSPEAQRYAECLTEKGMTPAEHVKDRYQQLLDAGIDPHVCLDSQ